MFINRLYAYILPSAFRLERIDLNLQKSFARTTNWFQFFDLGLVDSDL